MTAHGDLLTHPLVVTLAVSALAFILRAGLAWQGELSWYEYRTLHGMKRLAFPRLHPYAKKHVGFSSLVNDKGGRRDAEYLSTDPRGYKRVAGTLRAAGGDLHLISSVKRRPPDYGDPLTVAHVTFLHDDGTQSESYLFRNDDGTTDVYAHHEPSPADPDDHLGGNSQADGDPRGVVREALA